LTYHKHVPVTLTDTLYIGPAGKGGNSMYFALDIGSKWLPVLT